MTIQLQDGKTYVTRSGDVVTVSEFSDGWSNYKFISNDGTLYTEKGKYWSSCGDFTASDIVSEYNPAPPIKWKFPVGSTIKNRYQASGLYVRAHVKVLDEEDSRSESLEYYCYDIATKQHALYSKDEIEERYSLADG